MIDFIEYIKRIGFDVEKYNSLSECSDYELILQLKAREKIDGWVNNLYSEEDLVLSLSEDDARKKLRELGAQIGRDFDDIIQLLEGMGRKGIFRALLDSVFYRLLFNEPLKIEHFEKYFMAYEKQYLERKHKDFHSGPVKHSLPYTDNISPMSRWDLECFINGEAVDGVSKGEKIMLTPEEIENLDSENYEKLYELSSESLNCVVNQENLRGDFSYGMLLKLDLNKPDAEILKDLSLLLPMWRKQLGLTTPEKKREWEYIRRRMIDYRIIPLMDVLNLAKVFTFVTGKRVSKKVMALLVYPDGRQDGFGLHQTVLPFLDKIMGNSSKLIFDYKITK